MLNPQNVRPNEKIKQSNSSKPVLRFIQRLTGKSEKMIFLGLVMVVGVFVVYLTISKSSEPLNRGMLINRSESLKNKQENPKPEESARNIGFKITAPLVLPEPENLWGPWLTMTTGTSSKSNTWIRKTIEQEYVEGGAFRNPLLTIGNTIAKKISSVRVTWWDKVVINVEDELVDYLKRQLDTPFEYMIMNHQPWSQLLGIPTFEAIVENEDQITGSWRIWYHWPSVYYSYQDGQGERWYGSWFNKEIMRIGGAD